MSFLGIFLVLRAFLFFCEKPNMKVALSGRGGMMEPIFGTAEEK